MGCTAQVSLIQPQRTAFSALHEHTLFLNLALWLNYLKAEVSSMLVQGGENQRADLGWNMTKILPKKHIFSAFHLDLSAWENSSGKACIRKSKSPTEIIIHSPQPKLNYLSSSPLSLCRAGAKPQPRQTSGHTEDTTATWAACNSTLENSPRYTTAQLTHHWEHIAHKLRQRIET